MSFTVTDNMTVLIDNEDDYETVDSADFGQCLTGIEIEAGRDTEREPGRINMRPHVLLEIHDQGREAVVSLRVGPVYYAAVRVPKTDAEPTAEKILESVEAEEDGIASVSAFNTTVSKFAARLVDFAETGMER